MPIEINESIQVGCVFSGGRARPVWFIWKGRRTTIREVTHFWKEAIGDALLYYFSVTDGVDLFELAYNTRALSWRLLKVEAG